MKPLHEDEMSMRLQKILNTSITALVVLFLGACSTTLAPHYDQAIVDGLNSTSTGVMQLFASVSGGTTKDTFAQRENTYNSLIGSLDALAIQASSRPIPKNDVTRKVNEYLQRHGIQILNDGEAPSATAMTAISKTLAKMRDTDRKQGLTAFEVSAFKGQVVIYLDQATTYENFLQR